MNREIESPQELVAGLRNNDLFIEWNHQHPANFLSHLFCPLDSKFALKENWELGFFDPEANKITVFIPLDKPSNSSKNSPKNNSKDSFEIKPADDVFKEADGKVERLELEKVKLSFLEALDIFKERCSDDFPKEQLGEGFVVLQTYQKKAVWNFTFVTRSFKFVNFKIDAANGEVADQQLIDLISK